MKRESSRSAERSPGEKSDTELICELTEHARASELLNGALIGRGFQFLNTVLSTVNGFPTQQYLNSQDIVSVSLDNGGAIEIHMPMGTVGKGKDVIGAHNERLALIARLEKVPGVICVVTEGSMNSGIMSIRIRVRRGEQPVASSPEVSGVQGATQRDVRRVPTEGRR